MCGLITNKKCVLILVLLIFSLFIIHARGRKDPERIELEKYFDEKKPVEWTICFSSLKGINLSQENVYLTNTIPVLIKEVLEPISLHKFSEDEITEYSNEMINFKISSYFSELLELKRTLDNAIFGNEFGKETRKKKREYEKNREELKQKLNYLQTYSLELITFPDELPVIIKEKDGNSGGGLFGIPKFSRLEFAKNINVDFYIWGEIEEIQNYLYVKIGAYHTTLQKDIFIYEDALSAETIYSFVPEVITGLAEAILGREWSSVIVTPVPADCAIEIENEFKGIGTIKGSFIEPGEITVKVSHPAYITSEEVITLSPFEEKFMEVLLEKKETTLVSIISEPPNANIYLDSIWIGRTPLELDLPFDSQRLLVKLDGYNDSSCQLTPESMEELNFILKEDLIDENYWHKEKRTRFYTSFGIFALSLPIPIFLNGAYNDIVGSATNIDTNLYKKLKILTVAKGASIFLNVALFVNAFINLIEYIGYTKELIH